MDRQAKRHRPESAAQVLHRYSDLSRGFFNIELTKVRVPNCVISKQEPPSLPSRESAAIAAGRGDTVTKSLQTVGKRVVGTDYPR